MLLRLTGIEAVAIMTVPFDGCAVVNVSVVGSSWEPTFVELARRAAILTDRRGVFGAYSSDMLTENAGIRIRSKRRAE